MQNNNKYKPGYYVLNNTAIIEINLKDEVNYSISLVVADPAIRLPLNSAGTVISFNKFESIVNTYGKELIPIDPTKAEIMSLLYGS